MHPSHVLKLGIGDCKNQASLLQTMLERCGITSELVIGVLNQRDGKPVVHAWVRVVHDGLNLVCDPAMLGKIMDTGEYESVMGLIDITPEYLLKEPVSAAYGVGKISYPAITAD